MKLSYLNILCLFTLPAMAELKPVENGVYRWDDHNVSPSETRETRKILEGNSPHFEYLKIHATTQYVGAPPRPAHASKDVEELIIVKEGLMEVAIEGKATIMGTGSAFLLMPDNMHTIQNVGDTPLTYFVMQYRSKKPMKIERGEAGGGSQVFNINTLPLKTSKRGAGRAYFDRATAMCERFEFHTTQLHKKGPSHKPHAHIESEIILVISGETEMTIDGKEYKGKAGDLYFMESELMHGVRNSTDMPASYFAFKWH